VKTKIVFAALGIAALLLGLFLALPLFNSNLDKPVDQFPGGRAYITVDPVYAYFTLNPYGQDTASLPRTSGPIIAQQTIVNYLIILNVTSYSDAVVYMEHFKVYVAENASTTNTRMEVSQAVFSSIMSCTRVTDGTDDRLHTVYPTATRWEPYESRLVAFSGTTEAYNTTAIKTGSFYIASRVEGTPIDGLWSQGAGSKLITVTKTGNDGYRYNDLLGPGQALRFDYDGQIAYVDGAQ
jgi:hypothetical protein